VEEDGVVEAAAAVAAAASEASVAEDLVAAVQAEAGKPFGLQNSIQCRS
jgi:hypothetical protein